MKTTIEIIASLKQKLKRQPTTAEIDAERIRLGRQWYGGMAVTNAVFTEESSS
jgi:hypothetical protein